MSGSIWADPDTFVRAPSEAREVLQGLALPRIDHYLKALSEQGGIELQELKHLSNNTLIALTDQAHLKTRRVIAPFFSKKGLLCWESTIAQAIENALERLAAAQTPDLVSDFTASLFVEVMPKILGFSTEITAEHFEAIKTVQRLSEPYLSLATLKKLDAAVGLLINAFLDSNMSIIEGEPETLLSYLNHHHDKLPPELDKRYLVVGLLAGSNSATQTLAFALYGMLTGLPAQWADAATPGWAEREMNRILSLYQTTRTLVRVAPATTEVTGCPYHHGQARVVDIVDTNTCLRTSSETRSIHMSFGGGAHKCPGSELSVMFLSRAIPALAKRFPELLLHKETCTFMQTPMIQAPVSLPCDTGGSSRRVSSRMCDIREMQAGRDVVCDNENFSPPRMEEHLSKLAERSGRNLSTAITIARNAMFFMDGERHINLRRAISDRLGGNRLGVWESVIDEVIALSLDELAKQQKPDLAKSFSERLRAEVIPRIFGIMPCDQARFEELAPGLQDVLEPWLPIRELERVQNIFREAMALMQTALAPSTDPTPLLQALLADPPADFNVEDLKAATLVLYGATFTFSHTFTNILHWILTSPPEERTGIDTPAWIDSRLEQVISLCTGPKYIYRMARKQVTIGGLQMQPGDTARLPLLVVNRGVAAGHLSFGHGLHRCIGAALSRLLIRRAIPALFSRFPNITLVPQGQIYLPMSQTVALRTLPCRLGSTTDNT